MPSDFTYDPSLFNEADEVAARAIILTPEQGLSTEERWEKETEFLAPILAALPDPCLDIGCGAGRLAGAVVRRTGKAVVGIDISAQMRVHARRYVERICGENAPFMAINWEMLESYADDTFGSAFAVWALQHFKAEDLIGYLALLARVMRPMAPMIVVNMASRCVPVSRTNSETGAIERAWAYDELNLDAVMLKHFFLSERFNMPANLCQEGSYLTTWIRKP